jgi:hypothetical protein
MTLLLATAVALAACGGKKGEKGKTAADEPGEGPHVVSRPMSHCEAEKGQRVEETDLDDDGVVDVVSVFAGGQGGPMAEERLVCKETDLNFDGRRDLVQYIGEDGKPLRYEIDLDFDGKVDVFKYFAGGVQIRSEYDTNYDGKIDTWNTYDAGELVRSDRDRNGDGDVDESQYFDDDGLLQCLGYDTDGDNTLDHWERADTGENIENPSEADPCVEAPVGTAPPDSGEPPTED